MTELERQLATLLHDAPGEPPITVDPDRLLASSRSRRRVVAPLVAAALVAAIAVPTAVLLHRGSDTPSSSNSSHGPTRDRPAHSAHQAAREAQAMIVAAPTPPDARRVSTAPPGLHRPSSVPGAQHVQRSAFWTAPGTVSGVAAYLRAHPPAGALVRHSGYGGRQGVITDEYLEFPVDDFRIVQYTIVAYRGGVALRVDAQVLWAPLRDRADMVPASVTSVDITIVRQTPQGPAVPTVHRTLTGAAAHAIVEFVNRLPRAVPTHYASCLPVGSPRTDLVVFHSTGPPASLLVNLTGCASATFQIGQRAPIQLSDSYVSAVRPIDHKILSTIGLPTDYGG